eukprot:GHVQ01036131.1.p1 GENE.GHVQ01036131.1~~GHVQ01036131.1.p1  ORF type:complete len:413 (-),score=77.29 GHVQ01036131.1:167-1405(-)
MSDSDSVSNGSSDGECETGGGGGGGGGGSVGPRHDLSDTNVTTKYRTAGKILNQALEAVMKKCEEGVDILQLCSVGDSIITEETTKVYNKKENGEKVDKGIAFPTCISVNEICGHFSPLPNESVALKAGDLVKIDMGCHIDGYVCVGGHSIVLPIDSKITGRKADLMRAAWTAGEAALRLVKVGNTNTQVTKAIEQSCEQFKCNPVLGVRSHQMKRFIIEGNQCVASKDSLDERVEEFEFGLNEVYGIDIVVSTGEGKPKETDNRTTVYRRAVETKYQLKTQLARQFIGEVNKRFPTLPFTIRAIEDERACRLGVMECMRHELLQPYPVMSEKQGEFVVQFKFTVLLLPGGTKKITGLAFSQDSLCESAYKIDNPELINLLKTSANPKTTKRKAKAQLKSAQPTTAEPTTAD